MKGVFHIHSVFSDGEESLERIVHTLTRSGMDFAAVSDHAEVFDDSRIEEYVRVCESLTSSRFLVIPGLEFALHGGDTHILGYGVTRRVRAQGMEQFVDGIHDNGGLAVLAHPASGSINVIGPIRAKLDGIEVWNGRYDGVHSPRAGSLQLLRHVRGVNCKAWAYGGIDLHKISQAQKPIYLDLDCDTLDRASILRTLEAGLFTVRGGSVTIPSTGDLSFVQELSIAVKQPLCRPWAG